MMKLWFIFFPVAVTSSSAPPYWNLRTSFITS